MYNIRYTLEGHKDDILNFWNKLPPYGEKATGSYYYCEDDTGKVIGIIDRGGSMFLSLSGKTVDIKTSSVSSLTPIVHAEYIPVPDPNLSTICFTSGKLGEFYAASIDRLKHPGFIRCYTTRRLYNAILKYQSEKNMGKEQPRRYRISNPYDEQLNHCRYFYVWDDEYTLLGVSCANASTYLKLDGEQESLDNVPDARLEAIPSADINLVSYPDKDVICFDIHSGTAFTIRNYLKTNPNQDEFYTTLALEVAASDWKKRVAKTNVYKKVVELDRDLSECETVYVSKGYIAEGNKFIKNMETVGVVVDNEVTFNKGKSADLNQLYVVDNK